MDLKVGDSAPDFKMKISDNEFVELSNLRGKNIVLYFYPKDDTPGCTIEACDFNAHKSDFATADTLVIGVSKDNLKSHDKFKAKYELGFHLASDLENDTCEKYGVWGEKSMMGRKYMGINRTTFLIDKEGKIAHIWRNVTAVGHAKEVLKTAEGY